MKWFYNLKIGKKLILGYLIIAVIAGGIGTMGVVGIQKISARDVYLYEKMAMPLGELVAIADAFQGILGNVQEVTQATTSDEIDAAEKEILKQNSTFDANLKKFQTTLTSPEGIQIADETYLLKDQFDLMTIKIVELVRQGNQPEAMLMAKGTDIKKIQTAIQSNYQRMLELKLEIVKETAKGNAAIAGTSTILTLVLLVLGVAAALLLGLFMASMITKPVAKINHMIKEMSLGHLGLRLNLDSKDEIGEMATAMDDFAEDLQHVVIGTMHEIADGNLSTEIEPKDDLDEITPALKKTIETIRNLIDEANMLSHAAVAGNLAVRGNADGFKGGFKEILVGFNDTLDAMVGPLNIAADCVNKIGNGIIPQKITETYYGDFNAFKNSINACIDGLAALEEGNHVLGLMNQNDFTQCIEGNYLGIYAEIGESINGIRRLLLTIMKIAGHIKEGNLSDLEELKKSGKRSDNDRLIPTLVEMMENIVMLVDEGETMAALAIEGDLNHRGNSSKFSGEYARVIEGFNQTLDAVIEPIIETKRALKELAQGNLNISMEGAFKGQHGQIKEDMNQTIGFLKRYVDDITLTLKAMGEGNLDQAITSDYLGDFRDIKTALNDITTNLSTTLRDIDVTAAQVEVGARQISDGGQALSQGSTEQASAIEELTASIAEVADETSQNAIRAGAANERSIAVRKNAATGNLQMGKMVSAMVEINDSSSSISKVIKVIDDIAFQTNILALNAAVEAARAGQHGKGFAVVAQEVRNLAVRSAKAVKETSILIEGSIEKVAMGTKIADETAVSLKEILDEIEKITTLVGTIAQASNDQAMEITQINQGIEQVSKVVQTNAATAEESAAASEELSGQAEILREMVGAFRLKR
ncbi:methyl-accepting chemotaxis protein [Acetobacterium bakii]|uniref:methyl-accepting chemotaxis protein n=1 Tax=Acetobacterium bakii TaxID=52689 RepID=UPI00067FC124|nr:methyl-accepting chemotaxis protein [Acetobacterium bakii]